MNFNVTTFLIAIITGLYNDDIITDRQFDELYPIIKEWEDADE